MTWCDLILEVFCTYSFASKKRWNTYAYESLKKAGKKNETGVWMNNKMYTPNSKRVNWCKKNNKKFTPCYKCLELNCPFLAYTEGTIGLKKHIQKYYEGGKTKWK